MMVKRILLPVLLLMTVCSVYGQQTSSGIVVDYRNPREYVVGGIKVKGFWENSRLLPLPAFRRE